MKNKHSQERLERAKIALEGLSLGDSLGGFFEFSTGNSHFIRNRQVPQAEWRFTDDTNMALSIYSILRQFGEIRQDELAQSFAEHFDKLRGYGKGARAIFNRMRKGQDWRTVSQAIFVGGSYDNGGAMRVAPLGAYFADDMDALVENARLSSEITHAHPEGIAGTIAVAVASAIAWLGRGEPKPSTPEFINRILPFVPEGEVKARCQLALELSSNATMQEAVELLGNGSPVTAQHTVPFTLWCAGRWLDDFEEAFWMTASGGGDVDTTCAIVCGIIANYVGREAFPKAWLELREDLSAWAFEETTVI